jgi:hypothetical protein
VQDPLNPVVVVEGQTLQHVDRVTVDWRRNQLPALYITATTPGVLDGIGQVMEHDRDSKQAVLEFLDSLDPDALDESVRASGNFSESMGAAFLRVIKAAADG